MKLREKKKIKKADQKEEGGEKNKLQSLLR